MVVMELFLQTFLVELEVQTQVEVEVELTLLGHLELVDLVW
jgi:hypothetical protein